jgi:hypothetical protein
MRGDFFTLNRDCAEQMRSHGFLNLIAATCESVRQASLCQIGSGGRTGEAMQEVEIVPRSCLNRSFAEERLA